MNGGGSKTVDMDTKRRYKGLNRGSANLLKKLTYGTRARGPGPPAKKFTKSINALPDSWLERHDRA